MPVRPYSLVRPRAAVQPWTPVRPRTRWLHAGTAADPQPVRQWRSSADPAGSDRDRRRISAVTCPMARTGNTGPVSPCWGSRSGPVAYPGAVRAGTRGQRLSVARHGPGVVSDRHGNHLLPIPRWRIGWDPQVFADSVARLKRKPPGRSGASLFVTAPTWMDSGGLPGRSAKRPASSGWGCLVWPACAPGRSVDTS